MTDEVLQDEGLQTEHFPGSEQVEINWRDSSTVLIDNVLSFADAENILRITFGQLVYSPGGQKPRATPVLTLAASEPAWQRIVDNISEALRTARANREAHPNG